MLVEEFSLMFMEFRSYGDSGFSNTNSKLLHRTVIEICVMCTTVHYSVSYTARFFGTFVQKDQATV